MKTVFTLIVFVCTSVAYAQNDTLLRIFRTVHLQNGRKLPVQSTIDKYSDIVVKVNKNNYYVKKSAYEIADSMGIEVNNEQKIMAVSFLYNYDTAYVHEQHKYQKMISPGKEFIYNSNGRNIRVTKWYDTKTTFELIEIIENGKKQIYSVIFDNELYYKKYNHCIDLRKHENSIEFLRLLGVLNP